MDFYLFMCVYMYEYLCMYVGILDECSQKVSTF